MGYVIMVEIEIFNLITIRLGFQGAEEVNLVEESMAEGEDGY